MTVGELLSLLTAYPEDAQVILAKDAEGNGFGPCDEIVAGWYEPETTWRGEFTQASDGLETDADDADAVELNAVCLWPIN